MKQNSYQNATAQVVMEVASKNTGAHLGHKSSRVFGQALTRVIQSKKIDMLTNHYWGSEIIRVMSAPTSESTGLAVSDYNALRYEANLSKWRCKTQSDIKYQDAPRSRIDKTPILVRRIRQCIQCCFIQKNEDPEPYVIVGKKLDMSYLRRDAVGKKRPKEEFYFTEAEKRTYKQQLKDQTAHGTNNKSLGFAMTFMEVFSEEDNSSDKVFQENSNVDDDLSLCSSGSSE